MPCSREVEAIIYIMSHEIHMAEALMNFAAGV